MLSTEFIPVKFTRKTYILNDAFINSARWSSCCMNTQCRHDGDARVKKTNQPVTHTQDYYSLNSFECNHSKE